MGKPTVLILGATGCLGSAVLKSLTSQGFRTFGTSRATQNIHGANFVQFEVGNDVEQLLNTTCPNVIVNCIVSKLNHNVSRQDFLKLINTNSRFPRKLNSIANRHGMRVIHFSTDAVFSGLNGSYTESEVTIPRGKYAFSKRLGEVQSSNVLNIRLSFVPRHLETALKFNLFTNLRQSNSSQPAIGFVNHLWNGITDIAAANAIVRLIQSPWPQLSTKSILHLSSATPISKFELYQLLRIKYSLSDAFIIPKKTVLPKKLILRTKNDQFVRQIWNSIGYLDSPSIHKLFER